MNNEKLINKMRSQEVGTSKFWTDLGLSEEDFNSMAYTEEYLLRMLKQLWNKYGRRE